jgi:hypothetical protein
MTGIHFQVGQKFGAVKRQNQHPILVFLAPNNSDPDIGTFVPENMLDISSDVYFVNYISGSNLNLSKETSLELIEFYVLKNITIRNKIIICQHQSLLTEILRKATRRQNFRKVLIYGAVTVL